MTFSIKIYDNANNIIGELPTATVTEIIGFINKGLHVIDRATNEEISLDMVNSMVGVSECIIG